jgi:ribosomal protein S21
MPIVIKATGSDSTSDVIRKFKKAAAATNIVQNTRDRRYFQKPSKIRAQKKIEKTRLRRKSRSLKQMKNIGPDVIDRIRERIQ